MLKFNVQVDARKLTAKFDAVEKQAKFATAVALTRSAKAGQTAVIAATDTAFENVTGYTKRGFYITAARKDSLTAWVGVKKQQAAWLNPEILGGPRGPGIERFFSLPPGVWLVPTANAKTTGSGRVSIAWLRQIAAALQTAPTATGKFKGKRKSIGAVFCVLPGSGKLRPGIYSTQGTKTKMLLEIVKQPRYRKRFDFYGVAARAMRDAFPNEFRRALREALATAR